VNAIQDEIVRIVNGGLDSSRVLTISAAGYIGPGVTGYTNAPIGAQVNAAFMMAIPLREGDRVLSITYDRIGNGVADLGVVQLQKTTAAAGTANLINTTDINPAAAWADNVIAVGAPVALAAGETLTFYAVANAAGITMGNMRITYDHP
jgi:hypothetical protein